ncbi:outer membrane protein transport protein [Acinetobacter sp. YH12239]|uniref:OmpP1/FadL family transporter n=1 Tax=Acinetobacter sp. YH12239 TaxID=2601166 RepID=UPI0015D10620
MKLTKLSAAVLFGLASSGTFAAALDRSGQSISSFLQPGNYFEAGISILDPSVSGKDLSGNYTGDMAGDYYFPTAALKIQATDNISVGLLYDQPFGADAEYTGTNNFVASPADGVLPGTALTNGLPVVTANPTGSFNGIPVITDPSTGLPVAIGLGTQITGNTSVEVDTQNLSLILGYQPTENFNFYGGAVYQTVKGNVKLRGSAYSLFNGYDADIPEDNAFGWLAGAAYQIPEIALKASITYRSEIDHKVNVNESIPLIAPLGSLLVASGALPGSALAGLNSSGETKITTPQSVNLDLQSGIMANTVAFANIRWVDWSSFSIRPHKFGQLSELAGGLLPSLGKPNGFNLVDYSKDQWSVTTGVGRKFNEQWAGNVSVGWDSGAGNPVTTLGPTEGYWNVGLGLQYSPTPATFIAGGVKYFWLGDADAQTGAHSAAGKFEDNDALAYGLKIGYKF